MAQYSQQEKDRLINYPIESVLQAFGRRTEHRGRMYYSPFRQESTPSFCVDPNRNVWKDFGEDSGGNVLTLVCRLKGITPSEAWDVLADLSGTSPVYDAPAALTFGPSAEKESKIIIDKLHRFINPRLEHYARSRGIPPELLRHYCMEASYHISGHSLNRYYAIAFPTCERAEWVLRGASDKPGSKRVTRALPTFFTAHGELSSIKSIQAVVVFEGFFDFLSWLKIKGRTLPFYDVCVLNSVSNLDRAMPYLLEHESIICYLDNDEAGRKALEKIKSMASDGQEVHDNSVTLVTISPDGSTFLHKDVNEYLMAARPSRNNHSFHLKTH